MNVVREAQCWREATFFLKKREPSELENEVDWSRQKASKESC